MVYSIEKKKNNNNVSVNDRVWKIFERGSRCERGNAKEEEDADADADADAKAG
jgi:hypothetical protein